MDYKKWPSETLENLCMEAFTKFGFKKEEAKKYAKIDLDDYNKKKAASEKDEAASAERDRLLSNPLVNEYLSRQK